MKHDWAFLARPPRALRLRRVFASFWMAGMLGVSVAATASPSSVSPGSVSPGSVSRGSVSAGALSTDDRAWVRETLGGMSLERKAAQMIMVPAFGYHQHARSEERIELSTWVGELGVGGVVVFDSDLASVPYLLEQLQAEAEVPLLVAADFEGGIGFRVRRGGTPLPAAMAVGATGSVDAARFKGDVTARESLALGIHWLFAPVADVNNDPANPVINLRSFGEDPALVSRLTRAFIEGASEAGALTTAKHFPGHGDTAVDSHEALPVVRVDRARLDAVELAPFRAAIAAGVDAVMVGHIAVPTLDPSGVPASLSEPMVTGVLRGELGFDGLIVTDAMDMKGVGAPWTGEAAVRAVRAGVDVVVMPPQIGVAVQAIVRAVGEGVFPSERLDRSVERILEAKARLGLHELGRRGRPGMPHGGESVSSEVADAALAAAELADLGLDRRVGAPGDRDRAARVADAAITLVRNEAGVLPLRAEQPLSLLHLVLSTGRPRWAGPIEDELEARHIPFERIALGAEVTEATVRAVLEAAARASHVLVSSFHFFRGGAGHGIPDAHVKLLDRLLEKPTPVVVAAIRNPYVLAAWPTLPTYLCAFGDAEVSQAAVVRAVLGEVPLRGRLPVAIPDRSDNRGHPSGHGIDLAKHSMTLERAEHRTDDFSAVDAVIDGFLDQGAFPGAALAVGYRGELVHARAYGKLSYDSDAPPVTLETRYDLASLTKVIATTTMAMILVDQERLRLDHPVQAFLPRFTGAGKHAVTVRHLLTHASGVDWWAPLYEEMTEKAPYLERIQSMDLVYEPGARTMYSDLGVILLGEILERVAGESIDAFVEREVFAPLGMHATGFRPASATWKAIAPTENDPWRGRVLRGEVHDENAHALGGVAPHAGLFGTAIDLARFAQMMLNGGILEHRRIVSRPTVDAFTRRAGIVDSTRALGWDTKSARGSSAGSLFSPNSYGHTGYTGTSLWIDPQRQLFVVLLTNRVHPSRENKLIRQVRPAVADAVVRAVEGEAERPE